MSTKDALPDRTAHFSSSAPSRPPCIAMVFRPLCRGKDPVCFRSTKNGVACGVVINHDAERVGGWSQSTQMNLEWREGCALGRGVRVQWRCSLSCPAGQVGPTAGHLAVTCTYHERPTSTPLRMSVPDPECLPDTCPPTQIPSVGQGLWVLPVWDSPSSRLSSEHNCI